jgi:hypothetical protein
MNGMFAMPDSFAAVPGLRRCGRCDRELARSRLHELGATPGV